MGTDKDWEIWGAKDPYYGVLSSDRYRSGVLDDEALEAFFRSGTDHVQKILKLIHGRFEPQYSSRRVLDVGCGVGRLLIPFAKISTSAVGVDISPSMIKEASRNCSKLGASNTELLISDDTLSSLRQTFDLIHSSLVLQHMRPRRGMRLIEAMANRVAPGGYLVIQFYHACHAPLLTRALVKLRYTFPPANWFRNIYRRRPMREPPMQLHVYDLSRVLDLLVQSGLKEVHQEFTYIKDGEFESVLLVARKHTRVRSNLTGC